MSKTWTQLVVGLLIAAWGGSLGFGFSQANLGARVVQNSVRYEALAAANSAIREEIVEIKRNQLAAMEAATKLQSTSNDLMREILKQSQVQSALVDKALQQIEKRNER